MESKTVQSKHYLCFTTETTLKIINEVAEREVPGIYSEASLLGLKQNGPLEFIYFNASKDLLKPLTLVIALPIQEELGIPSSKYSFKEFEKMKCFTHVHTGAITNLYQVYEEIFQELYGNGLKPTNQIREIYEKFESLESPENITEIQIGII